MLYIKSSLAIGRSEDIGVIFKNIMPCQPPLCVTLSMEEDVPGVDSISTDLEVTLFYSLKYLHVMGKGSLCCTSWDYPGIFCCV